MNKTSFLALLCGLTAGSLAGFGVVHLSLSPPPTPERPQEQAARQAPRFGDWDNSDSGKMNRSLFHSGMEPFIRRCSGMTNQELLNELQSSIESIRSGKSLGFASNCLLHYLAYNSGAVLPQETLKVISEAGNRFRDLGVTATQGWISLSPAAAADFIIKKKKEYPELFSQLNNIGEQIAKDSPERAVAWLSSLPEDTRSIVLPGIINTISQFHLGKLAATVKSLNPEDLKSNSSRPGSAPADAIARIWAASDWAAAKEWIKSLPPDLQRSAFRSAFNVLADKNMEKALQELEKCDDMQKMELSFIIAPVLAKKAPEKLLNWIPRRMDNEEIQNLMAIIAFSQATITPELKEKALRMKNGAYRDSVLAGIAESSRNKADEEGASLNNLLSVSTRISDQQKREDQIEKDLHTWMKNKSDEVRQWVRDTSEFSPEWKQSILQRCDEADKKKAFRSSLKSRLQQTTSAS